VSVGIAETKTLAKIANRVAKRTPDTNGVFDLLACPDRDALLGRVPVEDVWGIGRNLTRLLNQHGIMTALQLREVDDKWIRKNMGIVGLRLVMELRGVSCLDLEECPSPKQSVTCSRSFGQPISTLADMEEAVSSYTSRVGEKLRRERLAATVLTVCLTTNEFKEGPQYSNSVTLKLSVSTDSTSDIIRSALQGIRAIYREGYLYKKAGVIVTGLVSANQTQADLFDSQNRAKSKRLMSALDAINSRWGADTLHYASSGIRKAWKTQFQHRSPAYTTDWGALPVVMS
jgi:DNA polymerase V